MIKLRQLPIVQCHPSIISDLPKEGRKEIRWRLPCIIGLIINILLYSHYKAFWQPIRGVNIFQPFPGNNINILINIYLTAAAACRASIRQPSPPASVVIIETLPAFLASLSIVHCPPAVPFIQSIGLMTVTTLFIIRILTQMVIWFDFGVWRWLPGWREWNVNLMTNDSFIDIIHSAA